MDGIHDMGGMHGFGDVPFRAAYENEPLFPERWQSRVFALTNLVLGTGMANVDCFRHAVERVVPQRYLEHGYYGRWLAGLEQLLVEKGALSERELADRIASVIRDGAPRAPAGEAPRLELRDPTVFRRLDRPPRFQTGDRVRTARDASPGHTRLPRYARDRVGEIRRVYPACVFPDTNAHDEGEQPQYLYSVQFRGEELWGNESEPGVKVALDLFEPYLSQRGIEQ